MALTRLDPALAKALAEGTYVVDPHAVAEAMLRRGSAGTWTSLRASRAEPPAGKPSTKRPPTRA